MVFSPIDKIIIKGISISKVKAHRKNKFLEFTFKEVTIKIYTSSGKLLKELSVGSEGKAEWGIADVSSGIYLYVISSPAGTKEGKLSVIK